MTDTERAHRAWINYGIEKLQQHANHVLPDERDQP